MKAQRALRTKAPTLLSFCLALPLALQSSTASAHAGAEHAIGFSQGLMHPITGLDHVLAMVMVGMLAWQLRGWALWTLPLAFVLVMAMGGALGVAGVGVPRVEAGIALSVIVLGAMVAIGVNARVLVATALVGLFAVFHGHAHGAEMPEAAVAVSYGLGFVLGTALLHLAGIGLGALIGQVGATRGVAAVRAAGAVVALAGVAILVGAV